MADESPCATIDTLSERPVSVSERLDAMDAKLDEILSIMHTVGGMVQGMADAASKNPMLGRLFGI